jgi:hypothetical protein
VAIAEIVVVPVALVVPAGLKVTDRVVVKAAAAVAVNATDNDVLRKAVAAPESHRQEIWIDLIKDRRKAAEFLRHGLIIGLPEEITPHMITVRRQPSQRLRKPIIKRRISSYACS